MKHDSHREMSMRQGSTVDKTDGQIRPILVSETKDSPADDIGPKLNSLQSFTNLKRRMIGLGGAILISYMVYNLIVNY